MSLGRDLLSVDDNSVSEGGCGSTIFTIGHSTRSIPEFVDVLQSVGVNLVVDIRTVPRSRTNPQFNEAVSDAGESLADALAPYQIGYRRIAALGGLRGKQTDVAPQVNGYWDNKSFHNYADYALSSEFYAGLTELEGLTGEYVPAIMCAEAVWWRCHRRIVTDYLIAGGYTVYHLMGAGRKELAKMTPDAVIEGRDIVYPGGSIA